MTSSRSCGPGTTTEASEGERLVVESSMSTFLTSLCTRAFRVVLPYYRPGDAVNPKMRGAARRPATTASVQHIVSPSHKHTLCSTCLTVPTQPTVSASSSYPTHDFLHTTQSLKGEAIISSTRWVSPPGRYLLI